MSPCRTVSIGPESRKKTKSELDAGFSELNNSLHMEINQYLPQVIAWPKSRSHSQEEGSDLKFVVP